MRVVLVGLDVEHRDVLIEQQRNPVERGASAFLDARSKKMAVVERLVRIRLELYLSHTTDGLHRRRRMYVVHERRRARESLVPN